MNRIGTTVAALGLCVAVAACQTPQQRVAAKEDMMVAAGFKFVPANTPERQAAFKTLPPHQFMRQVRGDKVIYVYADPTICGCLYMGGTTAYNTYIRSATALNMQREYKSETTDSGYLPGPWMLDGGPWDDADMYGLYVD